MPLPEAEIKTSVNCLEGLNIAQENRSILKSFYGVLKPTDEYLEFARLMGGSKFAKVSRKPCDSPSFLRFE